MRVHTLFFKMFFEGNEFRTGVSLKEGFFYIPLGEVKLKGARLIEDFQVYRALSKKLRELT